MPLKKGKRLQFERLENRNLMAVVTQYHNSIVPPTANFFALKFDDSRAESGMERGILTSNTSPSDNSTQDDIFLYDYSSNYVKTQVVTVVDSEGRSLI